MPRKPMTPEQHQLWDEMRMGEGIRPTGDQTPQQAENLAVASFRYACAFDGIPVPGDEAVRAAMRAD